MFINPGESGTNDANFFNSVNFTQKEAEKMVKGREKEEKQKAAKGHGGGFKPKVGGSFQGARSRTLPYWSHPSTAFLPNFAPAGPATAPPSYTGASYSGAPAPSGGRGVGNPFYNTCYHCKQDGHKRYECPYKHLPPA